MVPVEALMKWAREWAKEGVALDWKKIMPRRFSGVAEAVGG
jgi:hypothetical protein